MYDMNDAGVIRLILEYSVVFQSGLYDNGAVPEVTLSPDDDIMPGSPISRHLMEPESSHIPLSSSSYASTVSGMGLYMSLSEWNDPFFILNHAPGVGVGVGELVGAVVDVGATPLLQYTFSVFEHDDIVWPPSVSLHCRVTIYCPAL